MGYFQTDRLASLGVTVDMHGKMPDVVLYFTDRDWLLLIESVTSHGPVDAKRHDELATLFKDATPGLVYVTAFPDRGTMGRYLAEISWETEVWCEKEKNAKTGSSSLHSASEVLSFVQRIQRVEGGRKGDNRFSIFQACFDLRCSA